MLQEERQQIKNEKERDVKTVGIIGGIGPESTIEYYRQILACYREEKPDGTAPSIVINSIDVKKVLDLVADNELGQLTEYLASEVQRLARAGADFAVLAANTPHIVFDKVQQRSSIPLISIVQSTCDAAKALGSKRVGLFGTRFTMQAGFYQKIFSREGIAIVLPAESDQAYVHDKYVNELLRNIFLPATHDALLAIADKMIEQESVEALIQGGTELPLILRETARQGIPFLDTTRIHVRAVVAQLLA
jgi:aspartate racemase